MAKQVLNGRGVCHAWANQTQEAARTSNGNLYFDGATIYSYGSHFPIARHVTNEQGARAVLFTTRDYSPTTSKHKAYVRSAASHLDFIFCHNVGTGVHAENFGQWEKDARAIASKLETARKPSLYLEQLEALAGRVETYAKFFGVETPAEVLEYLSIRNREQWASVRARDVERERERQTRAAERRAAEHAEQLRAWRAFETRSVYTRTDRDYLRYNADARRVETSQGVEVPAGLARRLYFQLLDIRAAGGCANVETCNLKVLQYDVRGIYADRFEVGCHTIHFAEAETIANLLQWTRPASVETPDADAAPLSV